MFFEHFKSLNALNKALLCKIELFMNEKYRVEAGG